MTVPDVQGIWVDNDSWHTDAKIMNNLEFGKKTKTVVENR